ncbi:MAG: hypothetical protein CMP63_01785 [Flavobacteriales bacterium]|nr:hypothetical protein [Flavobacteriales bacterium]
MKKFKLVLVLVLVFVFNFSFLKAFNNYEGYLGARHNISFGLDIHPTTSKFLQEYFGYYQYDLGNSVYYDEIDRRVVYNPGVFPDVPAQDPSSWEVFTTNFYSYSIHYEFSVNKFSSLGLDLVLRNSKLFAQGEFQTISPDNCYDYDCYDDYYGNSVYYLRPQDFAKVSGINLRLKYRRYLSNFSGLMSPLGLYFDYIFNLPLVTTKYLYDSSKESSSGIGFGIAFGRQGIIYDKVTYDIGLSSIFNSMKKKSSLYVYEERNRLVKMPAVYQNNTANYFGGYFKVGYLIY